MNKIFHRKSKASNQLQSLLTHLEAKASNGKLKVFLGMASGVGKTYSMLKIAKDSQKAGTDVVIGVIDAHDRKETLELTKGFEVLALKTINHEGTLYEEFDLKAALTRKPELILIDELEHTNAPSCKHAKRYLDIIELINAGINVHTTVNIQHLESRIDTIQQITGISVSDSVPDSILDLADEVVLIDLIPEQLLDRLREGKIYPKEKAEEIEATFFKKGNLTALREMALRLAAERVDRELRDYKQYHGIEDAWKSGSRLMVAIFASPYSETLIRWTRRLADLMNATWIGVYVEINPFLSEQEKVLLAKNMSLVHELGGEIISTVDDSIVSGLMRVARQNNVTQIVVGKSLRGFWSNLLRGGSIIAKLLAKSDDIDIYAVAPIKKDNTNQK